MRYDRLYSVLACTVNRVGRVETLAEVDELLKEDQGWVRIPLHLFAPYWNTFLSLPCQLHGEYKSTEVATRQVVQSYKWVNDSPLEVCFNMVTRSGPCPSGGGNLLVWGKTGTILKHILKPEESHSGMRRQGISWYLGDVTWICFNMVNLVVDLFNTRYYNR